MLAPYGWTGVGLAALKFLAQPIEFGSTDTLITGPNTMENENLRVEVNGNGTVNILCKNTNKLFANLNYLTDEGECGNAWMHDSPRYDKKYDTLGMDAKQSHQPIGLFVCEGLQQHAVHDAEHCRVGPDAETERQHGHSEVVGASGQSPNRVLE